MKTNDQGYDPISIWFAVLVSVLIVAITLTWIDVSPAELLRMWLEWMAAA